MTIEKPPEAERRFDKRHPARLPAPGDNGECLVVTGLEVRFRRTDGDKVAVSDLSYSLSLGKTLAIIGESGSGKTVSARAVMGLLPAAADVRGSIVLGGKELIGRSDAEMRAIRGRDVSMVFQDSARSLDPTMRIGTQIVEAARAHGELSRAAARKRAIELLRRVGMSDPERRMYQYAHELSGGMQQRTMIAIAIACKPQILIADEATTALDVTTQAQVMELLLDLQREYGMALLMISHDLALAANYADEVLVMYAGKAVERAPTQILFRDVRMPYTDALLSAVPRPDPLSRGAPPTIEGQPPERSLGSIGCSFSPRCASANMECQQQCPPLLEMDVGHFVACWHPLSGRNA